MIPSHLPHKLKLSISLSLVVLKKHEFICIHRLYSHIIKTLYNDSARLMCVCVQPIKATRFQNNYNFKKVTKSEVSREPGSWGPFRIRVGCFFFERSLAENARSGGGGLFRLLYLGWASLSHQIMGRKEQKIIRTTDSRI